jgi:hypothetical protein
MRAASSRPIDARTDADLHTSRPDANSSPYGRPHTDTRTAPFRDRATAYSEWPVARRQWA